MTQLVKHISFATYLSIVFYFFRRIINRCSGSIPGQPGEPKFYYAVRPLYTETSAMPIDYSIKKASIKLIAKEIKAKTRPIHVASTVRN